MVPAAILIAVLIWLLVRRRAVAPGVNDGQDRALALLRERFARGEISVEEYEKRCHVLEL